MSLVISVKQLPHAMGLPLPAHQSEGAAGVDLFAAIPAQAPLVIAPGARALVPTGLTLELPQTCEAQVRPRSGLALKSGVTVLNSPGTIDSDYRGEIGVILINHGTEPFEVTRGARIAQMVIAHFERVTFVAGEVSDSVRGAGGFGSTGGSGSANVSAGPRT